VGQEKLGLRQWMKREVAVKRVEKLKTEYTVSQEERCRNQGEKGEEVSAEEIKKHDLERHRRWRAAPISWFRKWKPGTNSTIYEIAKNRKSSRSTRLKLDLQEMPSCLRTEWAKKEQGRFARQRGTGNAQKSGKTPEEETHYLGNPRGIKMIDKRRHLELRKAERPGAVGSLVRMTDALLQQV